MGDLSHANRVRIECAIARGERPEYIAERLGVRLAWVDRVRRDMDIINQEQPVIPQGQKL